MSAMSKFQKLVRFVGRERRLVRELRPQVGIRRAVAARARDNMELGELQSRVATHDDALVALPAMGRALEGLAARIDRLDGLTAGLWSAGPAPGPPVPPGRVESAGADESAASLVRHPRRPRPQPSFTSRDGHLRILGVNAMFPLISETYVREELLSLVPFGADIAWYRSMSVPAPLPVPEPVFDDFERAIDVVQPDLAFVHWLTAASSNLPLLERHALPFGVRAHGFDFDRDVLRELMGHPLCIGAWTYPSPAFEMPGAHPLAPIFSSAELLQPPAAVRDKVVSVSAGLPKKDWPMLLDAFDRIHLGDRRMIIGATVGFEATPSALVRACEELGNPPLLQMNMVREDVLALLPRTAVSIYTMRPGERFGMPMSIVDALCAGCSVIVPDWPEAIEYAGPDARAYRTAEDIARHAHEVLAGGPEIEAEWLRNMLYGRQRFCDPQAPVRFNGELRDGLARVRAAQG